MAIKNALLGGSDWINGDVLFAVDINDTFDAAVVRDTWKLLEEFSGNNATNFTSSAFSAKKMLMLVVHWHNDGTQSQLLRMQLNGDTTGNYSFTSINSDASVVVASGQSFVQIGASTGELTTERDNTLIIFIAGNSDNTADVRTTGRFTSSGTSTLVGGSWTNASPITSIKLLANSGNMDIIAKVYYNIDLD